MQLEPNQTNGERIATLGSDVVIRNAQEALELLMNCSYNLDTAKIIVHESNLTKDFFDLKTGMAGEILQKFSNYDGRLAIIGDYSKFNNKNLHDFMYESNRMGRICFVNTKEEAIKALSR